MRLTIVIEIVGALVYGNAAGNLICGCKVLRSIVRAHFFSKSAEKRKKNAKNIIGNINNSVPTSSAKVGLNFSFFRVAPA